MEDEFYILQKTFASETDTCGLRSAWDRKMITPVQSDAQQRAGKIDIALDL